jgi:thiosulfate/3-mercaptopyruvate sulfurtransferase
MAMTCTTLVDTATLSAHVHHADWAVVDCRFALEDPSWGERAYAAGHVPGAVYAHLDRDLAGPRTGTNGRHPLPDAQALARTLGTWGIGPGVQVVAYDQDAGMYASRLWWLLRWLGHDQVAVLDGGFARWTSEGREVEQRQAARPARTFLAAPRPDLIAGAQDADAAGREHGRLIDARAPERYRGDVEPLDRTAGHIPGAVNRFFRDNVREDGTFRPAADLHARWSQTLAGAGADRVVCYCGSGVTACHNLLALEHAGLRGARLYPGSWSEWSSDPARPVATGGESPDATDGDRDDDPPGSPDRQ